MSRVPRGGGSASHAPSVASQDLNERPFSGGGGFSWEVRGKYPKDERLLDLFQRLFMLLPLASLVGQYAFGACPGHPFLLAVLRAVATAHAHPGWAHVPATPPGGDDRTVLYTTGPALVTRARLARTRLLTPEAGPWPWH